MSIFDEVKSGNVDAAAKSLAQSEFDANQLDEYGLSLLAYATLSGDIPMMQLLLKSGVGVDEFDISRGGESPLMLALDSENIEVIKILLEWNPNLDKEGWMNVTPRQRLKTLRFPG